MEIKKENSHETNTFNIWKLEGNQIWKSLEIPRMQLNVRQPWWILKSEAVIVTQEKPEVQRIRGYKEPSRRASMSQTSELEIQIAIESVSTGEF